MHHHVDRAGDVLVHGGQWPVADLLQHQRGEAVERVERAVGVHGAQRTVVPGVERLQQVHRLGAADLADHQPVGAHAQRGAQQVGERDLADAVGRGLAGLQPHDVRVTEAELGDVFQRDEARLLARPRWASALSSVVLPDEVAPLTTTLQRRCTSVAQQRATTAGRGEGRRAGVGARAEAANR